MVTDFDNTVLNKWLGEVSCARKPNVTNLQMTFHNLLSSKSLIIYNVPECIFKTDSGVAGPKC